jgi:hypothetical protein
VGTGDLARPAWRLFTTDDASRPHFNVDAIRGDRGHIHSPQFANWLMRKSLRNKAGRQETVKRGKDDVLSGFIHQVRNFESVDMSVERMVWILTN